MQKCYYPVTSTETILSGTHNININWTKNAKRTSNLFLTTSLLFANNEDFTGTLTVEECSSACFTATANVNSFINTIATDFTAAEDVDFFINVVATEMISMNNATVNETIKNFVEINNGTQISNFKALVMSCLENLLYFLSNKLCPLNLILDHLYFKEICLMYFVEKQEFNDNIRKHSKQVCCPVA